MDTGRKKPPVKRVRKGPLFSTRDETTIRYSSSQILLGKTVELSSYLVE
jgi:hypothetical protein